MQNAECKMQNVESRDVCNEVQTVGDRAQAPMQNAECKMQNVELRDVCNEVQTVGDGAQSANAE